MRVLFIGGTGLISTACTRLALERDIEVVHLNRASGAHPIEGVETLVADVHDEAAARKVLGSREFDAVVDWIAYGAADIEREGPIPNILCETVTDCAETRITIRPNSFHRM